MIFQGYARWRLTGPDSSEPPGECIAGRMHGEEPAGAAPKEKINLRGISLARMEIHPNLHLKG